MANWKSIEVQIPGKDLLKDVRQILETLLVYLEVLKTILETIKVFLIDFGNPLKALLEALIKLITTLIEALKKSGVYAYWDIPNPIEDPNFMFVSGGFEAFKERFSASLYDAQDINRPLPIAGANQSQYFVILVDAQAPLQLLALVGTLLRLLRGGVQFYRPSYPEPANVRVVPVGDEGDPILSLTGIFTKRPKALALEWSLSTISPSADGSFTGVTGAVVNEFVPPKWLIERSEKPLNTEVYVGRAAASNNFALGSADDAGFVTALVPTSAKDPRTNATIERKARIYDEYGVPFTKFQQYIDITAGNPTFLTGQLGTFRWIDKNVEYGKTYYYRVRAYTGKLDWADKDAHQLNLQAKYLQPNMNEFHSYQLVWPAANPAHPPVMGQPSGITKGTLFPVPDDLNIQEALFRTFLAAFSLNFHLPLPQALPARNSDGEVQVDADENPVYGPRFTEDGDPIAPLTVEDIGKGSIDTLSGTLASFTADPIVNLVGDQSPWRPSEVTGKYPEVPWVRTSVRFQAGRMANRFSGFFMESVDAMVNAFVDLMLTPLPEGTPPTADLPGSTLKGVKTLKDLVYAMTDAERVVPSATGQAQVDAALAATTSISPVVSQYDYVVTQEQAKTYGSSFSDAVVRKNVLVIIRFLRSTGGQGMPPNWQSISLLRDLVPWSGQFLYDLLAKIQAMLDAFRGVLDEIKAFIDLLIRKIDALEAFIQYLINLLNFVESMSLGFYFLDSGLMGGDANEWITTIYTAEGNKPTTGPDGYTAGVVFGLVGPDIGAFASAFKLIFG